MSGNWDACRLQVSAVPVASAAAAQLPTHPATLAALGHQAVQLEARVSEVGAGVVTPDGHSGGIVGTGSLSGCVICAQPAAGGSGWVPYLGRPLAPGALQVHTRSWGQVGA